MAKKKRVSESESASPDSKTSGSESGGSVEGVVAGFAEDLGALLGKAQNKAESWLGQRAAVVKQLEGIRDTASSLLGQLGQTASEQVARLRRRGRKKKRTPPAANPAGALKPEKRKKKGITAAGRAAISAAQKARWAAYKNKRVPQ